MLCLMLGMLQTSCSFFHKEKNQLKQVITAPCSLYVADVQNTKGTMEVVVKAWEHIPTTLPRPPRVKKVIREGQSIFWHGIRLTYRKGKMIVTSKSMCAEDGKKRVVFHTPGKYFVIIEIEPEKSYWKYRKQTYEPFEGIRHPAPDE